MRTENVEIKIPKTQLISRTKKPTNLTLQEWQTLLRKEYGRMQNFKWKNLGDNPVFSEFLVTNPANNKSYRVVIRSADSGNNRCSCPDFTINTLGTCKHIEFILSKLKNKKGLNATLRRGYNHPFSEIFLRYGSKREIIFYAGTECPRDIIDIIHKYFSKDGILFESSYHLFDKFLNKTASFNHKINIDEDVLSFVAERRDQIWRTAVLSEKYPDSNCGSVSKLVKTNLYPYQQQGALLAAKMGRCLVGDEMGLGKTVQALAATEILAGEFGIEKALIICPTSLKHQWKSEIEKFTNRPATVIEGNMTDRKRLFQEDSFYKIINYDVVHRDLESINGLSPDLIILDEAQRIKNWKTRTAQNIKKLNSQYAFVLTGTPLENRLEELHSIVEFVDRYRLGPMFNFLYNHQILDECGKVVGYKDLNTIGETIKPILIRRNKKQVNLQLPERLDKNFFVPMTLQQLNHHDENKEIVARIVAKWRRYKFLTEADQRRLTCALQNMRMSCNSTYLLDSETNYENKITEITTLLSEVFEDPSSKVVIFSQWLKTHELLLTEFKKKRWESVFYHGSVPSIKRKELTRKFLEDPKCKVFLSTDAGGTGLNLQHANVIINVDLPWNPAVLEQRIGRVHRLGQHKPVRVVNYIAKGTIEEGILSLINFKKSVFSGILDGDTSDVFLKGSRLNQFMDTIEKTTTSIPKTVLEEQIPEEKEFVSDSKITTDAEGGVGACLDKAALTNIFETGLGLLAKLGNMIEESKKAGENASLIHHDNKTGETYFRLPKLEPDKINKITEGLSIIASAFKMS